MFKLTDDAAVVMLITVDKSLYIVSDGNAGERYSIPKLLYYLNRYNNEKEIMSHGKK